MIWKDATSNKTTQMRDFNDDSDYDNDYCDDADNNNDEGDVPKMLNGKKARAWYARGVWKMTDECPTTV